MARDSGGLRQLLSAAAVVLSLIFVGLEIRQNTAAQRAQTRQALAEASREFTLTLGSTPNLALVYSTVFPSTDSARGATNLTPADSTAARLLMFTQVRNAENVFLQFREGVVDENVLQTYAFACNGMV